MGGFLARLLDTADFPQRWFCGNWSPALGWLHIIADLAIFGAYVAIPIMLVVFARRRNDVPFLPVFWLFGAFILSCGVGHLVEATIFWHPWYRLSGVVKAVTAIASWATAIALLPVLPQALRFPGLEEANRRLQIEVGERQDAEERLRGQADRLEGTCRELESFANGVVDREERVMQLKDEVNRLLEESGREPRYRVVVR
jgi:hypothetical protein